MILVVAAMQRAGSRWYFLMANDLLVKAGGGIDALEVKQKTGLQDVLRGRRTHLAKMTPRRLERLQRAGEANPPFAIHTHRGPGKAARKYLTNGVFKLNYVCRDMRDVMLSALDRGNLMRTTGQTKGRYFGIGPYRSFARIHTVAGASRWAQLQLMPRWRKWMQCPDVMVTRYEDLVADPDEQLRRLADFMGLDASDELIAQIVAAYDPNRGGERPQSFVKGKVGRYKEAFSPEQQEMCRRRLAPYLKTMGYLD